MAIAGNDTADLFQQIFAVVVLHWRPQEQRECGQYFPIRSTFPGRLDGGAYGLNMALLICPCAGFLQGGGGREYHMGEGSGFRHEKFLADQEL